MSKLNASVLVGRTMACTFPKRVFFDRWKISANGGGFLPNTDFLLSIRSAKTFRRAFWICFRNWNKFDPLSTSLSELFTVALRTATYSDHGFWSVLSAHIPGKSVPSAVLLRFDIVFVNGGRFCASAVSFSGKYQRFLCVLPVAAQQLCRDPSQIADMMSSSGSHTKQLRVDSVGW